MAGRQEEARQPHQWGRDGVSQAIPSAVLEQHLAILGKTGRGKTNTGKVCIEQVYAEDSRVCILDPVKSDWWGLTSSADGQRAGLPFHILGGPHGHLPLLSSSGKAIADLVARGQLRHTIIDMRDFEPGGQVRWFADFAPRLMQRIKGVLYLVIEEAHLFAPKERVGMGHENMSIHWAKQLATAGRSLGIRLIVLSQRTQALHNAVIGSCDSMIVHGMTAPADMEPVTKWLKANNKDKVLNMAIEGSLSGLKRGTGWLCSSEAKIFEHRVFPKASTYDNTATPTDNEEVREVMAAPVDLEGLKAILGKAAQEAIASDPSTLRKRIQELEGKLAQERLVAQDIQQLNADIGMGIPITAEELDATRKQGFSDGYHLAEDRMREVAKRAHEKAYVAGYERATAESAEITEEVYKSLTATLEGLRARHTEAIHRSMSHPPYIPDLSAESLQMIEIEVPDLEELKGPRKEPMRGKPPSYDDRLEYGGTSFSEKTVRGFLDTSGPYSDAAAALRERAELDPGAPDAIAIGDGIALNSASHPGSKPLTATQRRILGTLNWLETMGEDQPTRGQLGALANCRGSTLRNRLSELKTMGFISYPSEGRVELDLSLAPITLASREEEWFLRLTASQGRIYRLLLRAQAPLSRETIAETTRIHGSTLRNRLSELKTMGVVNYPREGEVALTPLSKA